MSRKVHYINFLILLSIFALRPANVKAQFNRLFTTEHDLPNSLIGKVREDADEMIWIATADGLCRFDGSRVSTYRHDAANPHSIQADYIRTICSDQKGHVFVGTTAGLQMYRPATDDFTTLIADSALGIEPGNINDLQLLSNGDLLVAGTSIFTLHTNDDGSLVVQRNPFTGKITGSFRACQDYKGDIWIIRFNDGLLRLKHDSQEIEEIKNVTFTCIGVGQDGGIYAGGLNTGIYKYSEHDNQFHIITPEGIVFSAREFCQIPHTDQMYVATDGNGIFTLDCNTGDIEAFELDDSRIDIRSQKVHSLCISRNGELWMGIFQKGVMVQVNNLLNFKYFGTHSLKFDCIGDHCVTSLLQTSDKYIWVATDNGGIYCIDQQGQTHKHITCGHNGDKTSLPSAIITLFEDSQHRIWFGSYGQGGGWVNLETGHCQYINVQRPDGTRSNIYAYAEDKRGQVWTASMGMGIMRYDPTQQMLLPYPTLESTTWSTSMCYDADRDALYTGTFNGLAIIPLAADGTIKSELTKLTLRGFVINSVMQYDASHLAISSDHGLVLFDTDSERYEVYAADDGLSDGTLYAAETDSEGNIWTSGSAGLSKYNISQGIFTNYTSHDGIKTTEFYQNASLHNIDGSLWFGGTDGITWFHPDEIYPQAQAYEARIVGLYADHNTIHPNSDGVYQMSDEDHSFTLELATRPILLTHRVIYRYAMDDDSWQTLPPMINSVSYSHIASGHHTFRFQAINGEQVSGIHCVTIEIAHPWYSRWWAWIIWSAVLLLLMLQIWHLRIEHIRRRKIMHIEAINEAKLQSFMNIAHEFRTPMTLIVGPLQKLISTDSDTSRQRTYQLIDRNANRILNLINQMMDLRKIDLAQMRLNCQLLPIVPLLREQVELISDMSEQRKISTQLTFDVDNDTEMWIDKDHFEKIMLNLLSNAIKYTPEGGYVAVECRKQEADATYTEGSVTISVTDNGIGIPPEDRAHIFERFYQARRGVNNQALGTGIGLNLVHSLVMLHHGQITFNDNPKGQGSQFVVTLPLGDSLFTDDERAQLANNTPQMQSAVVTTASIINSTLRTDLPAQVEGKAPSVRYHILIADDDAEIRSYLYQELTPYYRVTQCEDGQEAFDVLMKSHTTDNGAIDLVLSDLMMPKMDGLQLCQKIRSHIRLNHIPFILLTARTGDEDRLKCLEIGANAFVTKPFNIQLLLPTIRNILDNQTRLRNTFSGQQVPSDQVDTPVLKSPDERLLERIVRVVNENLSNPDLTSELIASQVGLSRVHLYRKLKELTNQSARNYIRNIRLTKAAELLSQKKMAVSEVAYQVGFTSSNNFTTAFKELYGMSPTEYMEQKAIK